MSECITIELDAIPPSVNSAYRRARWKGMYMTRSAHIFKSMAAYIAAEEAKRQNWKMIPKGSFFKMRVGFAFKNYRFPDPNNLMKILIDAFEGILFENDKWLYVVMDPPRVTGKNRTVVKVYRPNI